MINRLNRVVGFVASVVCVIVFSIVMQSGEAANAIKYGLTMAPMEQKMILNIGDSRDASFTIANPSSSTEDMYYDISVEPFYVDESGNTIFEAEENSGEMVNWITFNVPVKGKIAPNEVKEVSFTIDVPESAPAGGQYVAIFVTTDDELSRNDGVESKENDGAPKMGINEIRRMGHLIYAEVAGTTIRKGEINNIRVPSFLFSGNIGGSSSVKNLGNVHGEAEYILQVFPLFSDEEVYSIEESPEKRTILPNRSLYSETVWDKTPGVGIFNVVYHVEFEGSVAEVSKMVIVCPLWLLFIIIFVVVVIIMWLIIKAKQRKKE